MVQNEDILKTFEQLVAIDSPSLREREMSEYIKKMFSEIGISLKEDDSAKVTGSNAGNLYGYIQGGGTKSPLLLSAHMDTVQPACGKKAVVAQDGVVRSDGTTVLGADDLAGLTEIYHTIKYLRENNKTHRDIELLFTTGEELYGKGVKAFDCSKLKSKSAYVLDLSGEIGMAAYAAPTILSFCASVKGRSAHAGFCPEDGVNAILAVSNAISKLPQGRVDEQTTANIGMISGGAGINIVPEKCVVRGEIRSLKHEAAVALADRYREVFEKEAQKLGAALEWDMTVDIKAYETNTDSAVVREYKEAVQKAGIEARLLKTFGGSDNNVLAEYGIEGMVIANSMHQVHSCQEYTNIDEMQKVVEILISLLEE